MSDPHGWICRRRLSPRNFDFIVTYRPELNNQVPNALLRCTLEACEDVEDENKIHTFEEKALVFSRAQAASREEEEDE